MMHFAAAARAIAPPARWQTADLAHMGQRMQSQKWEQTTLTFEGKETRVLFAPAGPATPGSYEGMLLAAAASVGCGPGDITWFIGGHGAADSQTDCLICSYDKLKFDPMVAKDQNIQHLQRRYQAILVDDSSAVVRWPTGKAEDLGGCCGFFESGPHKAAAKRLKEEFLARKCIVLNVCHSSGHGCYMKVFSHAGFSVTPGATAPVNYKTSPAPPGVPAVKVLDCSMKLSQGAKLATFLYIFRTDSGVTTPADLGWFFVAIPKGMHPADFHVRSLLARDVLRAS
jgi:hypothetical protein